MSIENATELKHRVAALLRDTRTLHTCAGLGFTLSAAGKPPPHLKLEDDAWSLLDLRGKPVDDARAQIGAVLDASARGAKGATKPMVLVVDESGPRPAFVLAQALADRRAGEGGDVVDLGDHVERTLAKDLSAVVVVEGIADHDKLPRMLQRVDYWEMIGAD